jgi:threonine/homoserine/homoserine lactone efflux protein
VTIISAGLVGLLYCAAPGPVNVETLRRGLRGGFWGALGIQLGALLGEIVYALIALAGLEILARTTAFHLLLGLVGTAFLIVLGWSSLRQGWRGEAVGASYQVGASRGTEDFRQSCRTSRRRGGALRGGALLGAAISLASPFGVAFWLSAGGTVLRQARADAAPVIAGFVLGSLLWAIGLPTLLRLARPAIGRHAGAAHRAVSAVCGLALIGFGLALGWTLLGG